MAEAPPTSNNRLPPPLQRFRQDVLVGDSGTMRPRIMFPPNGARIELTQSGGQTDPVPVKVAGGKGPLMVLVNGVPLAGNSVGNRTLFFTPDGPGFLRLTITDARGAADSVTVRIQ